MNDAATIATGGKNGTKWIGTAMTVLGALSVPGAVPPSWTPYILGLGGLLTLARGFINTKNQQQ